MLPLTRHFAAISPQGGEVARWPGEGEAFQGNRFRGRWIVVAGPTAAGKSDVALSLAERFAGEIVNADSRQVYRGMDVGTAKPSAAERARVPHHLFDVVAPDEPFDAALYRDLARRALTDVAARGRLPIVVGGTGLYIRALARGLFAGPPASARMRAAFEQLETESRGSLVRWCHRLDPVTAARIHPNDRVRLVRALEVTFALGVPLSTLQRAHAFADTFGEVLELVIDPGVDELDRRIAERSHKMFASGLVEELRRLEERGFDPTLRSLQAIGYREAADVLHGRATEEDAIGALIKSTRRFARRQRIWFRREAEAIWIHPSDKKEIEARVTAFLKRS